LLDRFQRIFIIFLGVVVCLHLTGCETLDTSPSAEGTGIQIFGAIYAAAKYKELNAAEAERVRIEAQRVFDRNVERELERPKATATNLTIQVPQLRMQQNAINLWIWMEQSTLCSKKPPSQSRARDLAGSKRG